MAEAKLVYTAKKMQLKVLNWENRRVYTQQWTPTELWKCML